MMYLRRVLDYDRQPLNALQTPFQHCCKSVYIHVVSIYNLSSFLLFLLGAALTGKRFTLCFRKTRHPRQEIPAPGSHCQPEIPMLQEYLL
ncbi:hypothetical protein FHX64_000175 [Microbacter margulisiae]|uniref:Uncharacterized protein n=1 Tax=Microbacter margulisiae TaxID=1350067 RepID=A0A7W5DN59_9PORP|nr:hypothetical protein [Microbacter margulisiae]